MFNNVIQIFFLLRKKQIFFRVKIGGYTYYPKKEFEHLIRLQYHY